MVTQRILITLLASLLAANSAHADFRLMQIEQIIAGVNGDTAAQAIQLRMRAPGNNGVSAARLTVVDAAGANPILLKDMTTDVLNSAVGSRVLLTTPTFANYSTTHPLVSDFTMAPIPSSYLAAGQLRYTDDAGTIYWSVSWGGNAFTGSTIGDPTNDFNAIFGPPIATAMPSTSLKGLRFDGLAPAASTTNLQNYVLTPDGGPFTNNAGTQYSVGPLTIGPGDFNSDFRVDGLDFLRWQRGGSPFPGSAFDLTEWRQNFGDVPQVANVGRIPEPLSTVLLLHAVALVAWAGRHLRSKL